MSKEIPSPCRNVCQLNAQRICIGCGRSIDEIAEWPRADAARRLEICAAAQARMTMADSAEKSTAADPQRLGPR